MVEIFRQHRNILDVIIFNLCYRPWNLLLEQLRKKRKYNSSGWVQKHEKTHLEPDKIEVVLANFKIITDELLR